MVVLKRLFNANWARYLNLAVSCRKEMEPSSSSMCNLHLLGAPMVDFHKFFDGESLTQEDLVAWINVGMHHLICKYERAPAVFKGDVIAFLSNILGLWNTMGVGVYITYMVHIQKVATVTPRKVRKQWTSMILQTLLSSVLFVLVNFLY